MVPTSEGFMSGGTRVSQEVFTPAHAGPSPAVLLLHGSFRLLKEYRDDIVSFAEALVAAGIAAIMPHYLESTNTEPGPGVLPLIAQKRPAWRTACADAL